MIELECKLRIPDRRLLAQALRALGAVGHPDCHERNWTFDTADQSIFRMGGLLRIRTINGEPGGVLTLKRPAKQASFKAREEFETRIDDAEATRTILEVLGYRVDWYYEKRRQGWEYGACRIALDELPRLGCFIEIEGPDETTIRQLLQTLGLDPGTNIQESYRVICARHCQTTGGTLSDWRF